MTDDNRDYNDGEIITFVEKDNEAERPARMIGFVTKSAAGVRTADGWIRWVDIAPGSIRRVLTIQDSAAFIEKAIEHIADQTDIGLGDTDRLDIRQGLRAALDDLAPIPPEPPQWTTVKVTYSNPTGSHGWDYYFRDSDLPDPEGEFDPAVPRWTGPGNGQISWLEIQKMGRVEIMPNPGER